MGVYFVESSCPCEYPNCNKPCEIIDSVIANGRRCLEHAPADWIDLAERNALDLFHQVQQRIYHVNEFGANNENWGLYSGKLY